MVVIWWFCGGSMVVLWWFYVSTYFDNILKFNKFTQNHVGSQANNKF